MIKQKGRIRRHLIMARSAIGSTGEIARDYWRAGGGRRWQLPLVIFLFVTGFILVVAASVEALAPFIYSIF